MSSKQKTVLITGASRGIGLGFVKEYLSRGYRVIGACRNPDKADDLKAALDNSSSDIVRCDVADDDVIAQCYKSVASLTDSLDLLINNAGISNKNHPDEPPSAVNRKEFLDIMNTNAAGVLSVTNAFIPLLKKSEGGKVINIGSTLGSIELNQDGHKTTSYKCSKAALNMITKSFSLEYPELIFVSIHPGWVQTDMGAAKNRKPPVTVEQSTKGVADTADKIEMKDNGTFWSFEGTTLPY